MADIDGALEKLSDALAEEPRLVADQNAALVALREALSPRHVDDLPGQLELERLFKQAAESFHALDETMSKSGPRPAAWDRKGA